MRFAKWPMYAVFEKGFTLILVLLDAQFSLTWFKYIFFKLDWQVQIRVLKLYFVIRLIQTSGQSYKNFTIVINNPRVVNWAIS